jgi:hypothetical protein
MGIDPKGCFLGGMGGRSLAAFQGLEKVGFLKNPRNYSFDGVGWGVWRKQMGMLFLSFFLLWYGDLIKIFVQENIL